MNDLFFTYDYIFFSFVKFKLSSHSIHLDSADLFTCRELKRCIRHKQLQLYFNVIL